MHGLRAARSVGLPQEGAPLLHPHQYVCMEAAVVAARSAKHELLLLTDLPSGLDSNKCSGLDRNKWISLQGELATVLTNIDKSEKNSHCCIVEILGRIICSVKNFLPFNFLQKL